MSAGWTSAAKNLVPPAWRRTVRRVLRGPIYTGDYPTWAEAAAASQGYAAAVIIEKTISAARAVRDGRAAWERDTVLFPAPAANAPLLAAIQQVAAAHGGCLNLVDFGGALGSTWWQHRSWLDNLKEVRWSVVEQPQLVEVGRREFTTGPLHFYDTLEVCCAAERPTAVLLSSVLPYLEAPHALLATIACHGFSHLIIDRTGFVSRGRDRLTVQHVPPAIYHASYPCWFFDRPTLLQPFAADWRVVADWSTGDEVDIDAEHRGFMLEKITDR